MEQFPLALILTSICAAFCIISLLRLVMHRFQSRIQWIIFLPGSLLSFVLLLWATPWAYMTYYLRWLFAALYVAALVYSYIRLRKRGERKPGYPGRWFWIAGRVAVMGISGFLVILLIKGYIYKEEPVDLLFPFKDGRYYVMQGGGSRFSNLFHRNFSVSKYGYAMDIAKLNNFLNRASSVHPDDLGDYEIFGDTVIASADGVVLLAVDTVRNNAPGTVNRTSIHGNHMVIQCDGFRIFMAHFQKKKVFVKKGDTVKRGQPVGIIGNSGFTVEPHLHFNILKGYRGKDNRRNGELTQAVPDSDFFPYDGHSVPYTFNGEFYSINDIIKAGKK